MEKAKLVRRSQRVAFYGVPVSDGEVTTYNRMEHFTTLTDGKNPITYERHYVDKDSQDSDVTGYGTTLEYGFDHHKNDPVLADLFDNGKTTKDDEFVARKRTYSILPDSSGDGTDALQYSGSFSVKDDIVKGYAKVSADGKTCTFSETATP